MKIIDDTIESLEKCKDYYADICINVSGCFQNYLSSASDVLIEKMQNDLKFNMFSDIDLKSEDNTKEIFETFDRFFFPFGRFPAMNELTVVPTGDVPSFVQSSDVISPFELYKWYNLGDTGGLVYIHFLAALNVHLVGDKMISKNATSQFFHNLSMQALSKSNDTILLNLMQ